MDSSTSPRLAQKTFSIPQEIIDLIVDEVAYQSHTSRELKTLKTCSILSQSFHSQSRKYIFSEVNFKLDKHGQSRALKLVKILGDNEQGGLINDVRSFTFAINIPSTTIPHVVYRTGFQRACLKLQQVSLRLLKTLKLDGGNDQVIEALRLLSASPRLEHFSINGQRGFYSWGDDIKGANTSLVRLCHNKSLKSFHLERIFGLPESILLDILVSPRLRELNLRHVTIARSPTIPNLSDGTSSSFSTIENLAATGLRFTAFVNAIRSPLGSSVPFLPLPYLHTLALSVPTTPIGLDDLSQFLLHVSSSLEALELQHYMWSLHDIFSRGPIRLSLLTSLRNLSLSTTSFDTAQNFSDKLEILGNFLASNTSPSSITSIKIDMYVHRSMKNRHRDVKISWKDLKPNPGWEVIDSALTSPTFPMLRRAVFDVTLFYFGKGTSQMERSIDVGRILPNLAEVSSVHSEVNLHTMYSSQSFLECFHVL